MNRWWAAALPVGAAAMIGVALLAPSDSSATSGPRPIDIGRASYACPAGSALSMAAGQLKPGTSRSVRVAGGDQVDDRLGDAGAWDTAAFGAAGVVVTQSGTGSGASGYFAGTASQGGGGGLAVGRCPGPVDDAWFVGAGAGDGHFSTLVLSNLADTPAVADVRLWGTEGPIASVDGSGITLEPYEVRRIPVVSLAAGEPDVALQVDPTRGSMAAVVLDGRTKSPTGTEAIGSTLAPRRVQVVAAATGGARGRTLQLLNPGEQTARVDVDVIGGDGTFAGKGLQAIKVEPGRLREVEVPTSAGSGRQAYRISSDQPVATTMRHSPNDQDYAVAEATAPIDGRALVPVDAGKVDQVPDLVLTAPGRAATVTVEAFDEDMKSLGAREVTIGAGTTDQFPAVRDGVDGVAYVVVTGEGDVHGAARYVDGDLISTLALEAAEVEVDAPSVRRGD